MKSASVASASLSILLSLGGLATAADETPPESQAWRPVVVAPEQSLSLLDAVRLTLEQDPSIRLQDAQTRFKQGVNQELSGQFDMTLRANGGYEYNREELRDSTKRSEAKNRSDLDNAIPKLDSIVGGLNQALQNLQNPNVIEDPSKVDFTQGITNDQIRGEMLRIQSQLVLLTSLLQSTADPLLRADLTSIRDNVLESGINAFANQVEEVSGLPDQVRQTRADLGDTPEEQFSKRWDVHGDVFKVFRNGIIFSPYAELHFQGQNYVGKPTTDAAKGGQGVADLYRSEVGFDVRVPLRRGLGKDSVAAAENASLKDYESTRLELLHRESQSILQTTLAYWDTRSAADQLEVAKRSVTLQATLLNLTKELIKAGEMPAADEARTQASYADSLARQDAAERRLGESRVNLARVIGVALPGPGGAPQVADRFPVPPGSVVAEDPVVDALVKGALGHRLDLLAAQTLQEAATILTKGARLDTRRLLNLDGSAWGNSLGENEISNLDRWVFHSGSVALNFEMPFKNNQAVGRLGQRQASLLQASIDSADLGRTIALNVERLVRALRLSSDRLNRAQEAVRYYDKTIEDEQIKLKAGDSTLIDTILTEQQTTSARLSLVSAQQDYAATLARLLFESGLILTHEDGRAKVTGERLVTVPAPMQGVPR